MKEENLRNIEFGMIKQYEYAKKYNEKVNRIKELLESDDVKEYLSLVNEKKPDLRYQNDDITDLFCTYFNIELNNVKCNQTNKIYVYMGSYYAKHLGGMNVKEIPVEWDDPRCEYRRYQDLEQYSSMSVPISKCDKFEKNNNVIYDNSDNYYTIRREFASDILFEGQEKAKKYILSKYNGNNK